MSITDINLEQLNKPIRFNMVNSDNEEYRTLGLEPLYYKTYPRYINHEGNIFYSDYSHYECRLDCDIKEILNIMNSKTYERYEEFHGFNRDYYTIHPRIYKNQIFFDDTFTLDIYKNNSDIRKEINSKFGLKDEFYEPTEEEVWFHYAWDYFLKHKVNDKEIRCYTFNLTPHEYFDIFIKRKRNELKPFQNSDSLNGWDVRRWLNINANIFMNYTCSINKTGIYNEKTMECINTLLETKLDIYNFFDDFSKKSEDWQKTVKELLIMLRVYKEFIRNEKDDNEKNMWRKISHWNGMFHKTTSDMLVQFIGFDKIESQLSKTITTSKPNIYEEFFNLLIMDYDVIQIPRLIFDENSQHFKWIKPEEFITSGNNRECEEEIKLIKKYVPYKDRYIYFKDK